MRTSRKIVGVLVAALALVVLPAASAQAAPFTMSIDNAILDLGAISGTRAIDSQLEPPDPPATLEGDVSGGVVSVSAAGFTFPPKETEASGIPITINMSANEDITGTFDGASGALSLDVNLKATVEVLGGTCVISPIKMTLSSDNKAPYLGQEFSDGIEGDGVLGASWEGLPPVTGGGFCGTVGGLIAGPGGIAMSHGVYDFQTCETDPNNPRCSVPPPGEKPTKAPKITSGPVASSTADVASFAFEKGDGETENVSGFQCSLDGKAFEACDSGTKTYTDLAEGDHTFQVKATNDVGAGPVSDAYKWEITGSGPPECKDGLVGTPPNCHKPYKPKLGAVKVAPKRKAVRRGKAVKFTVKVKNVGKAKAKKVRVCVKAPKRLVKVKKCVTKKNLAAGKSAKVKFRVKLKRKARKGTKIKLKFVANGPGVKKKQAKAVIRVR